MYVFQLFDYYAASGLALLWVCFFECLAIAWVYGGGRYYDNLECMLGFRINPWLRICWMVLTPIITAVRQLNMFFSYSGKHSCLYQQHCTLFSLYMFIFLIFIFLFLWGKHVSDKSLRGICGNILDGGRAKYKTENTNKKQVYFYS